ncbi:dienelactone hydrolase [Ktedonobacter sp. SOSP1-52]|uniref:dienelactone hydrolase family protein n=1 Tax=Ktedonobacter sp. SOSP1-52 TaxID=2778366 RepID=UPI001A2C6FAB|nr:dienelactone hydrolase family protein [Ktedonobacter sp. SOSP1-52]GHO62052.1 dienelactone hydrolase [Ktedonobacter sp. SOSP1-52]
MTGMVTFKVDDRQVPGYLAVPEQGAGPGVLVLHAWWGLNDIFKGVCERLAQAGFVAFAPDLYQDGRVAKTIAEAEQLRDSLDEGKTYQEILGAISYLQAQEKTRGENIGVIGFSLGSGWGLLLEDPATAIVTFYGLSYAEKVTGNAAFLGHFAEHDEYESAEYMKFFEESLRERGKEILFHLYPGTRHWFFEEDRPEYDEQAAQLAWERTISFLNQHLQG